MSNTIDNLDNSVGKNCIYNVKSISASLSGSTLTIQYYMYINSWREYDDASLEHFLPAVHDSGIQCGRDGR